MNIGQLDAPNPTLDTMNPVTQGLSRAIQRNMMMQQRKKQSLLMPFVAPQAQQELTKAQLVNKYYGPQAEAAMNLQSAQSSNLNAEAAKTRYMLANPGFLAGDGAAQLQALIAMGVPVGSLGNVQPGGTQAPQAQAGGQQPGFNVANANPSSLRDAILASNSNGTTFGAQGPQPTASNDSAAYTPQDQMRQGDNNTAAPPASLGAAIAGSMGAGTPVVNQDVQKKFDNYAPFDTLTPGLSPGARALMNQPYAKAAYDAQMGRGYAFGKMSPELRDYMIGMAAGNGIDPSVAAEKFANGYTLDDLWKENKIDPKSDTFNKNPDYPATKGNLEKYKDRQAKMATLDVLSPIVTEGLGPYARTIGGYSPAQIADAVTGMNKEQRIKFATANILVPDVTNLRVGVAGGTPSVAENERIMEKSLTDKKQIQGLLSPDEWAEAQKRADAALNQGVKASGGIFQIGGNKDSNKKEDSSSGSSGSGGNVTYEFKDGKLVKTS